MRVQKRKAQNIEKKGKISMAKIKSFDKEDKIKDLGNKICKFVEYHEGNKGQNLLALAALAEILFSIREIFKSYDEQFKELEKHNLECHEINETGGVNNIKIVLNDSNKKEEII